MLGPRNFVRKSAKYVNWAIFWKIIIEDDFTKIESLIILTTIKNDLFRLCILRSIGFEYINSLKYHSQQTRQYTVQ